MTTTTGCRPINPHTMNPTIIAIIFISAFGIMSLTMTPILSAGIALATPTPKTFAPTKTSASLRKVGNQPMTLCANCLALGIRFVGPVPIAAAHARANGGPTMPSATGMVTPTPSTRTSTNPAKSPKILTTRPRSSPASGTDLMTSLESDLRRTIRRS